MQVRWLCWLYQKSTFFLIIFNTVIIGLYNALAELFEIDLLVVSPIFENLFDGVVEFAGLQQR